MNRRFTNVALVVASAVVVGAAGWWVLTQKPRVPATTIELPTTQQSTNTRNQSFSDQLSRPNPSNISPNTTGLVRFESKDLGITFLYPSEWGTISFVQKITGALGFEYSLYDLDKDKWNKARQICQGADNAKFGFDACWQRLFSARFADLTLPNYSYPHYFLSVVGNLWVWPADSGTSWQKLSAVEMLQKPCFELDNCTTFTTRNSITVQRRYGNWDGVDIGDYFIYVIPPSPSDKDTNGYIFSTLGFGVTATSTFDAIIESIMYTR